MEDNFMGLQSSRNMNLADPIIIAGLGGLGGGVIDSLKGKIKMIMMI